MRIGRRGMRRTLEFRGVGGDAERGALSGARAWLERGEGLTAPCSASRRQVVPAGRTTSSKLRSPGRKKGTASAGCRAHFVAEHGEEVKEGRQEGVGSGPESWTAMR